MPAANFLSPRCPSRRAISLLADKWSLLTLAAISRGVCRNGALLREIGDISQKMLTQTLRKLEHNGLVARVVHETIPPHVEYSLTSLGHSLIPVIHAMGEWAETHYPAVELAASAALTPAAAD